MMIAIGTAPPISSGRPNTRPRRQPHRITASGTVSDATSFVLRPRRRVSRATRSLDVNLRHSATRTPEYQTSSTSERYHRPGSATPLHRQPLFFDLHHHRVLRVDHLHDGSFSVLGYEFVGVHLGETAGLLDPVHHLLEGDAGGILEGAAGTDGHHHFGILDARPRGRTAFDEIDGD